ncbi:hypothetical protein SAMN05216232_3929 [Virgibacillus subterraneus]|uniref:SinR family protein n=1 Tax=Virgibacillus subterraneus TaxID=621109 RepID=A0A1H9KMB3_9BACI|nr:hypothetical protein [Virgibacillus subterraneus]SER00306.1 hypothetical protein SAMN05216232_3929 [Virgibacillus subterraneus]
MAVYLITYDLNKPGQDYDNLYETIKSLGAWCHYLDSTWLVDTSYSSNQIGDKLESATDKGDSYLIIKVTNDYQGWLPQEAWDWIHDHIGHSI